MSENKKPFFSVVVPTKNRSALLPDAIRSVLLQNFDDFELIISDNFNDERTRQAIQPFLGDSRVRYLRTEKELSMPEHWEFATSDLHGKYVMILTDRSVLKNGSLQSIFNALSSAAEPPPVCSWRWAGYDELSGMVSGDRGSAANAKPETLQATSIAQEFANNPVNSPYKLPRGLNSCYRADIAAQLRAKHGGFFLPLNPDYSSAFMLLAMCDKVLYFDTPLFLSQGGTISNGGKGMEGTAIAYLRTLKISDYYSHVPIKSPLVKNSIWNDLLSIRYTVGGNLSQVSIDWSVYFIDCYKELLQKLGTQSNSDTLIQELFDEWRGALALSDPDTRQRVVGRISQLSALKRRMQWQRSPLGSRVRLLKKSVYKLLGIKKHKVDQTRCSSILAASGFRS